MTENPDSVKPEDIGVDGPGSSDQEAPSPTDDSILDGTQIPIGGEDEPNQDQDSVVGRTERALTPEVALAVRRGAGVVERAS